ncbi:hypothetical protein A3733_15655 [Pseudoalteromonas shioyasakiensis]|nr:hypothetical protein A3733_15655 [Pseudoalteromonas shioyasakiensis]
MNKSYFLLLTLCLLINFSGFAFATNHSLEVTNQALKVQPSRVGASDPIAYFQSKTAAIEFAKQQNWAQVNKLTEKLINEYQHDGDTWYLLGLSYFQLADYQNASSALQRALAIGTSLKGITNGASNPNDLMVKIAEAYAELNNQQQAEYWLKEALAARWDDRPTLAGTSLFKSGINPHFQGFAQSASYKSLAGNDLDTELNRDQKWRADLAFLVAEIKRLHVAMYQNMSSQQFAEKVAEIDKSIPDLTDQQIVFQFMELIALLGNGHNLLIPAWGKKGNFQQLPFQFYQFSDGLYITKASSDYQQYVGYKVEAFADTPAQQALELTKRVNARDNEMQTLWLGPYYLSLLNVLNGLGISKGNEVTLTLSSPKGAITTITPALKSMQFAGFPKLPKLAEHPTLRYLAKNNTPFWSEQIKANKLLYVQFNDVRNSKDLTLVEFAIQLQEQIKHDDIEHMVLDLRHNSGGNGSLTPPLVATAAFFKVLKPQGKLFILIGRNTFSAGHDVAVKIANIVPAIFVGESSGTRPNVVGEAGWFNLPYSKQTGLISSQFHQQSRAEDHRIWLAPDMPITLSARDYFAGVDPVMDAVLTITKQ